MIRVVVVDDHQIVREGIRASLDADPQIEVVAEAHSGADALELVQTTAADVWVVDLTMPVLNGVELTRTLLQRVPAARVLILSMHTTQEHVVGAFQAGASGYAVKTVRPDILREAVRAIARGQSFIAPEVADVVLRHAVGGVAPVLEQLTPRERQVLQLVSEGRNAKEIGADLGISDKTVHAFRAQVMRKLDLHSVAELTKYAIRHGITTLA